MFLFQLSKSTLKDVLKFFNARISILKRPKKIVVVHNAKTQKNCGYTVYSTLLIKKDTDNLTLSCLN